MDYTRGNVSDFKELTMGLLVDGAWTTNDDYFGGDPDGRFQRNRTAFRNWVTPDGSTGQ